MLSLIIVIIIFYALIVLSLASGSPLSQFLEPLTQSHLSLSVPILSDTAVCQISPCSFPALDMDSAISPKEA